MSTKGAFLKEKLNNMANWVTGEVGKENLSVDIIAGIAARSELEVCVFAGVIQANSSTVAQRDWSGVVRVLAEQVPHMQEVVTEIKHREAMHAKFWRYMDLFVEVASTD